MRTLRTIRGHRSEQLVARARARVRRQIPIAVVGDEPPPPLRRDAVQLLAEHARERFADLEQAALLRDGRVRLLGHEQRLDPVAPWRPSEPPVSALWAFELHYHEHLVPALAAGGEARRAALALLGAWMEGCPPRAPALALSWHPYVVSSRVVPWCAALSAAAPSSPLARALTRSLWRQVRAVGAHLERDVGGNHLVRNAKALAVGGAIFAGPRADALRRRGQRLLGELLHDQLGADGGHVEGSPSYHALVLEDALDALSVARPGDEVDLIADQAARALGWLQHISPAGLPRPHLNDSSEAQAATTTALASRASALGLSPRPYRERWGLPRYRVLGTPQTRLILDAAPPARPDLPYHAHADSLAIQLQVEGVPMIVDRGVGTYTAGPAREWWRSTAAHSTVQIDDTDSSELWGSFRAGRLARTTVREDERSSIAAAHDGAGRARLRHQRRVAQTGTAAWEVADVTPHASSLVSRLHLAPGVAVSRAGGDILARHGRACVRVRVDEAASLEVVSTPHAERLGGVTSAPTLVIRSPRPYLRVTLTAEG